MTKCIKYILAGCLAGCAVCTVLTACTDWDDHYDADSQVTASQTATLWQNIQGNNQLSQFAALLKKTGYDQVLDASQTYTVWAPLDGTYDYDALSAADNDRLVREFIQNHIARNNYPVSGPVDEGVFMLNEKMMHFNGTSMQDISVEQTNVASANGTMHLLDGMIPFLQNIYESLNNEEYELDSISEYFHSFDVRKFDDKSSIPGPTLNGELTYLDSVFYEHNDLYARCNAFIAREDSNYTMLMPTNQAWKEAINLIRSYYNYAPSFDFAETVGTTVNNNVNTTVSLKDAIQLRDSVAAMVLVRNLFYNNNIYDNKKLNDLQEGETLACDSLVSTSRMTLFTEDAADLFVDAHRVNKSNGAIWVTDDLRMHPWSAWNPELIQEAESSTMLAAYSAGSPGRVTVTESSQNPDVEGTVSNNRYLEVQPAGTNSNPEVDFYLPSVRSTTYSIYVVVVPGNITNPSREVLPHRMQVSIGYNDENGKQKELRMKDPVSETNYYVNDPTKIDTVYVGDFTFPVAYAGTGDYYPYMRIRSSVTNALSSQYDRMLRIDCIILRPKELDSYLKRNPGYKYDKD